MDDVILSSLARAWLTCVIATALFAVAVAAAPYWDTEGYLRAVLDAWALPL